jgi:cytochrome c biogenesis protein
VSRKIKRFFLSRKIILSLILLILAAIFIAYIFPQRFAIPHEKMSEWRDSHPLWGFFVDRLGFDHVYSTPWFAVLLLFFLFSLIISTYEQVKNSIKKTFGDVVISGGKSIEVNTTEEELKTAIKKLGYLQTFRNQKISRFVKHPWGYWGNVLLHLGIVLVIASSLLVALTQKRGLLKLVEGELYVPGTAWVTEERGLLTGRFILPEAVSLDNVVPEFWETDDLKQLTTTIGFSDPQGKFKRYTLAINQTINYRGIRVYQSQGFGDAFFVKLTDKDGRNTGMILQIQTPVKRGMPSYDIFRLSRMPYLLKAKYFADAERKSMLSTNPLLVMHLVDKGRVIGEVSLKNGEIGQLGPYTAALVDVSKWAGMIFVDITGMPGIFLGFFIIIIGGGLTYFMPPREFYIRNEGDGFSITWKATRFENFYRDEYEKVSSSFGGLRSQ